jgi:hypothetical protein
MRKPAVLLVLAVAAACAAGVLLLHKVSSASPPPEEWVEREYSIAWGTGWGKEGMILENVEIWFPFWQRYENLALVGTPREGWTVENTPLGVRCVFRSLRSVGGGICRWRCSVPRYERPFPTYENKVMVYASYVSTEPVTLGCRLSYDEEGYPKTVQLKWGETTRQVVLNQASFIWRIDNKGFSEIQAIPEWETWTPELENFAQHWRVGEIPPWWENTRENVA